MFKDFFSLIFPQNCLNCHRALISSEKFLCTSCKIDLPLTKDDEIKDNELFRKFAFEPKVKSAGAFIYFHQGGITQKLLHHLKYQGKKELGLEIGGWYSKFLKDLDIDVIVPVPLHSAKKKKRGYNQSEYIAKGMEENLSTEVKDDIVKRLVATKTQTKKSKLQRWTDLENVYSKAAESISGKNVLVVDDVITTGATVGMLCDRLVEQNVKAIHIAAIARGK